jgi:hypothetical protein
MRQQHRPGEKLFVDWAGNKISVHEPDGGSTFSCHLITPVDVRADSRGPVSVAFLCGQQNFTHRSLLRCMRHFGNTKC